MRKLLLILILLIFTTFQSAYSGPYVTPVSGSACYDPPPGFNNVYQTLITGTTYDYDFNYSGLYSDLSCSNIGALGAVGSCTLRSFGIDYPRGRLFTIITYIPCPIDEYIPVLLTIIAVVGFSHIKRYKFQT